MRVKKEDLIEEMHYCVAELVCLITMLNSGFIGVTAMVLFPLNTYTNNIPDMDRILKPVKRILSELSQFNQRTLIKNRNK